MSTPSTLLSAEALSVWVDLQVACDSSADEIPSAEDIERWATAALAVGGHSLAQRDLDEKELSIRVVAPDESQSLNAQYRDKDKPTNVLSFPAEKPPGFPDEAPWPLLGDLVICAEVVAEEAQAQGKPLSAHWAHMVVHGCLHLLGFDHIESADADIMEPLEVACLANLGVPNPYDA